MLSQPYPMLAFYIYQVSALSGKPRTRELSDTFLQFMSNNATVR